MGRFDLPGPIAFVVVVASAIANSAFAQPPDFLRDYAFIPSRTVVHVTGGSPNYNTDLTIAGKFGLVTGYDEEISPTGGVPKLVPHAEFVDVHGILYNPLIMAPLPLPGWDVDKTLTLSRLKGTFGDPGVLHFNGVDGQGIPIALDATLHGPLLHLTGMNSLPPTCFSCTQYVGYKVDALAFLKPYADFNLNGTVDAADFGIWRAATGVGSNISFDQGDANGDGVVDAADYVLWRKMVGPATNMSAFADPALGSGTVPEPALLGLAFCLAVLAGLQRTHRAA